jgi:GNAT superfamily N-acetyltransferase
LYANDTANSLKPRGSSLSQIRNDRRRSIFAYECPAILTMLARRLQDSMDEFAELTRLSSRAVAAMLSGAPRLHRQFTPDSALILTGEPLPVLNVLVIGPEADPEKILTDGVTIARRDKHPLMVVFSYHVAASLAPEARQLGLVPLGEIPLMVHRSPTTVTAPEGCTVERATDWPMIEHAAALRARASDVPVAPILRTLDPATLAEHGVEIFVGSREGVPMSTVTATHFGATTGIWWMATPPEYQRQGVGRSLLAQVMEKCRHRGAKRIFLGTSAAGMRLYESLGFETIGAWSVWSIGA